MDDQKKISVAAVEGKPLLRNSTRKNWSPANIADRKKDQKDNDKKEEHIFDGSLS